MRALQRSTCIAIIVDMAERGKGWVGYPAFLMSDGAGGIRLILTTS
jgi:hypothetical protein